MGLTLGCCTCHNRRTVQKPLGFVLALIASVTAACTAAPSSQRAPELTEGRSERPETVIVHASRALPDGLQASIAGMTGVRWTRVSTSALVNLVRIDGAPALPARQAGTVLPFSIAAAESLPDADDQISRHLADGKAIIPTVTARMRGLSPGGSITIGLKDQRATLIVAAVIDDARTAGVEALIPLKVARELGVIGQRRVIVGVDRSQRSTVERAAPLLASPVPVRVGSDADVQTPAAGRLLALGEIKERFGEFSFVEAEGRWLEPDPKWIERSISETHIPVLGLLKCHRLILQPLADAMRELEAAGLSGLVTEQSFCYAPRVQFGDTQNISRHTWGIAVDINPSTNAFGHPPTQDSRLIQIMANHGFAWGGVWLTPDGMHFEFNGGTGETGTEDGSALPA